MRFKQKEAQTTEEFDPSYLYSLEVHPHEVAEVMDFLKEMVWRPYFASKDGKWLTVHFLHKEDAAVFKLRFGDDRADEED